MMMAFGFTLEDMDPNCMSGTGGDVLCPRVFIFSDLLSFECFFGCIFFWFSMFLVGFIRFLTVIVVLGSD